MYAIDGPGCSWYVDSYHITCYRSVLLSLRPCGPFDVGHPGVRFSHLVHSDLALDLASNGIFALHGFVQHMEIWKLLHMARSWLSRTEHCYSSRWAAKSLLEAELSFFSPSLSLVSESDHSEANQPFLVCCMSGRTS